MGGFFYPPPYREDHTMELMLQGGDIAAQGAQRSGQIWGQALQGVGNIAGQAFQQYDQEKKLREVEAKQKEQVAQMAERDAAWVSYVNGGEWAKDPQAAYKSAITIWGPKEGATQFQALRGAANLMQPKRDPEKDQKAAGAIIKGMTGMSGDQARAAFWPQARTLVKNAFPEVDVPEQYDPKVWAEQIAPMAPALLGEEPEKPEKGPAIGSFEDYAVQKFGPRPTPAQITQARKEYNQADDKATGFAAGDVTKLTPAAIEIAAKNYLASGVMPPLGIGDKSARQQILNRAGELDPTANVAANRAGYGADTGSLKALQKQTDAVSAFEKTAERNGAMLEDALKELPESGVKALNTPLRGLANQFGSEKVAAFNTIRQSVQNEYGRIISNPSLSGTMSDSARKEAEKILSGNLTVGQLRASLKILRQEAANRHSSYQEQLDAVRGRMGGGSATPPRAGGPPPGTVVNGYRFKGGDPNSAASWESVR